MEVLAGNDKCATLFTFKREYLDDVYEIYSTDFEIAEGLNYLGFHVVKKF